MNGAAADKVSIYLPTRNRVRSLEAAIHSVLSQNHENLELIVVDDGATDATPALLASLAHSEPRLAVLTNTQPRGAPAARNRAIRAAKGRFVTGLDDDDTFLPGRLRAFLTAWKTYAEQGLTPSCLYAQDIHVHAGGREIETRKQSAVRAEDLFQTNAVGNQVFAPRRHFLGCGLFNERLPAWQDLECFYRLLARYGPARLVDIPSYRFDLCPRPDRISEAEGAENGDLVGLQKRQDVKAEIKALTPHADLPATSPARSTRRSQITPAKSNKRLKKIRFRSKNANSRLTIITDHPSSTQRDLKAKDVGHHSHLHLRELPL